MPVDPVRSAVGKIAVHTSWANTTDRTARTQPARDSFMERFERQVDPDGVLDERERAQRAESAKKAHFARMALASAKARRLKAEARNTRVTTSPDATDRPEGRPDESLCGADLDGGARRAS